MGVEFYLPTTTFSIEAKATSWSPKSTGSALSCIVNNMYRTINKTFFISECIHTNISKTILYVSKNNFHPVKHVLHIFVRVSECVFAHIRFGTVLGHEGHSEVSTEEGPGQPTSSFPGGQLLPHHNSSLKYTLTLVRTKWTWSTEGYMMEFMGKAVYDRKGV